MRNREPVWALLHNWPVMCGVVTMAHGRYGQRKPDVPDWTCGAHRVIPDNSMDSLQGNVVRRVEFFVTLTIPSYGIFAMYQEPHSKEPPALFQTLASNFELCVAGLGFVFLDLDQMQNPTYKKAKGILLH